MDMDRILAMLGKKSIGQIEGVGRAVDYCVWDRKQITSTVASLTFFQQTQATGRLVTNLNTAGKIPWDMAVLGLGMHLASACTIADAKLILDGTIAYMEVMGKKLFEAPLSQWVAGVGLSGVTTNNATDIVSNGAPGQHAAKILALPIEIPRNKEFKCVIEIPTALGALSASTYVTCFLNGPIILTVN